MDYLNTKKTAQVIQSRIGIRTCELAINAYATDYDDAFPFFAKRQALNAFTARGSSRPYVNQNFYWPMVVYPYLSEDSGTLMEIVNPPGVYKQYRQGWEESDLGWPPNFLPQEGMSSSYLMGWGFFTTNALWEPSRPTDANHNPDFYSPRKVHHVRSASLKGLLIESLTIGGSPNAGATANHSHRLTSNESSAQPFQAAFVDGSTAQLIPDEFLHGFKLSDSSAWADPKPVLETADGIQGRDR